jgi:hypothetical protein
MLKRKFYDKLLERDDIEFGYKFTSGNVGVAGKR